MTLYQKVRAVESVYAQLEKEVATFSKATQMSCFSQCGLCCFKPNIEATPLELLPLAYHWYKEGTAFQHFEELRQKPTSGLCVLLDTVLKPDSPGHCSAYAHRALICRLFGYSAFRNKAGKAELVVCKPIKSERPELAERAKNQVEQGQSVPLMSNYYQRIRSIDPNLGTKLMPISQALLEALKCVLAYYAYPGRPRKAA